MILLDKLLLSVGHLSVLGIGEVL